MTLFALLLANLLLLLLILPIPIHTLLLHFRIIPPLVRKPGWRSTYYLVNMSFLWLQILLLMALSFGLKWSPYVLGLRFPTNAYLTGLFSALFILFTLGLVILFWLVLRNPETRSSMRSSLASFPRSGKERVLFISWVLSTGFGE